MIAQQGRVVAIDGATVLVRVGGSSGCAACDEGRGCGAGVFGRLLRNRPVSVPVPNSIGARVGQAVQVGIPEDRFVALVFRLYVLPLAGGLLGAALGFAIASRLGVEDFAADLWALVAAVCSAGLALAWTRRRLVEFPLGMAVHLLDEAVAPAASDCSGAGRRGETAAE